MDTLAQYQSDLVNLLLGDPALAVVNIYKFKDQVIADAAAQSFSPWTDRSGLGKAGCAVEVRLPAIRAKYPNVPGPQLAIEFVLRALEDPAINQSGLTAEAVGLEMLSFLDGLQIEGGANEGIELYLPNHTPALKPVYDSPDRFAYELVLLAELPRPSVPRIVTPNLTDDGNGNVTLINLDPNNPDALLYYTTDGSAPVIPITAPTAVVGATQLYTTPFAVPPGTIVRFLAGTPILGVGAGVPNCRPSNVGQATIQIP